MQLFLKNLLFTLVIPGAVGVYFPLLILRGKHPSTLPIALIIGGLLLFMGASAYFWTVWDFATVGRGTPLPLDAPKKLVVTGLYRYTRNPMYLGAILASLGWACIYFDAWMLLYAMGVSLAMDLFVRLYEEPTLRRLFGAEYDAYCQSVRRWILRFPRSQD